MATPAKANFKIKANGTWIQVWQIKNAGVPFDITGYDFELEIKKTKGATISKFLDLTIGNGITVLDAANGMLQLEIGPQISLTATQVFVYDLIAIKDGKPYVWLEGEMTFEPGVSYVDT